MSGVEPAHNFTCYTNKEEKHKVSKDHQTADENYWGHY